MHELGERKLTIFCVAGGLSFSPRAISAVMAGIGICGAVWALFVLPHAVNRRGHLSVIRTAGLGIVAIYSWPIIANELRRGGKDVLFYTLLPLFLAIQAVTLSTNGSKRPVPPTSTQNAC